MAGHGTWRLAGNTPLADPVTSQALRAIHEQPARHWSVETLGELHRAVARSVLQALHGPGWRAPAHLRHALRMTIASKLLRESDAPLSAIAARPVTRPSSRSPRRLSREHGISPGGYRRRKAAGNYLRAPAEAELS